MNEQEVMLSVLTKYFSKTEDEIKELMYTEEDGNFVLKEGASDMLIGMDEKRINRIKDEIGASATKKFDDGYKKAQKEVLTKFEADLKAKFGLETDKAGLDLIDELTASISKGGDLTEDTIKTNPLYLKLEGQTKKAFEEKIEELRGEFDGYKASVEMNKAMSGVKALARQEFLSLNPVLSEDAGKAERQVAIFLQGLSGYEYIADGDTYVIKNGETRLEDAHGNPVPFANFIKNKAEETFDFKVQEQRRSPGNEGSGSGSVKKKITRDEYNRLVGEYEGDDEKMRSLLEYVVV